MMLEACSQYWLPLLLAAIIGLITAWWIWGGHKSSATTVSGDSKVGDAAMTSPMAAAPAPMETAPMAKAAQLGDILPDGAAMPMAAVAAGAVPLMAAVNTPKARAASMTKPAAQKSTVKKSAAQKPAPKKPAATAKDTAPAVKKTVAKTNIGKIDSGTTATKPAAAKPKVKAAVKTAAKTKIIIPDNLEYLKGVGPKLNALLKSHGVTSFEQIANWSAADIREIDSKLGSFAGRIGRDNWVDQAKLLVKGDIAAFEKKYGSLGSEINRG